MGIKTTGESQLAMIDRLLLALEKEKVIFPRNLPIYEELLMFRRDGKKLSAPSGKHDDCVMTLAFALSLCNFSQQVGYVSPNYELT